LERRRRPKFAMCFLVLIGGFKLEGIREIKRRRASVLSISKVTNAMKIIAATRLRRIEARLGTAARLQEELKRCAIEMFLRNIGPSHPFFTLREVRNITLFVVSTMRGFCGGLSEKIAKEVNTFINMMKERGISVSTYVIGKKGAGFFANGDVKSVDIGFFDPLLWIKLENLSSHICNLFISGAADQVIVAYTKFLSTSSHKVVLELVLPIWEKGVTRAELSNSFDLIAEPSEDAVEEFLVRENVKALLWRALVEGSASEEAERLIAMDKAHSNAEDLMRDLTRRYNSLRQASITTELLDIIGGARAVQGMESEV